MTKHHPLTAQYASPEQWEGSVITSASDVYSLGVILFQLLTGNLPVPWTGNSYAEYRKIVCNGDLPLANKFMGEHHAATCREASTAALVRRLAGDLDAIISKALRKDVSERYATVTALAEDIKRHLQFLPVQARGGALSYRTKRFLRRNRAWIVSIGAVLLVLIIGLATTLYQTNAVRIERNHAEQKAERLERTLQQFNKTLTDPEMSPQLRARMKIVVSELKNTIRDQEAHSAGVQLGVTQLDELRDGKTRGGEAKTVNNLGLAYDNLSQHEGDDLISSRKYGKTKDVPLGRNYAILGRLLDLTGDRVGARNAYQNCATILGRALEAGDVSQVTAEAMHGCQAGLEAR